MSPCDENHLHLPSEARELLMKAREEKAKRSAERHKTVLTEGSEPCVSFQATACETK